MKLVIVGGVAGGASAAARARRLDEKAEIVMIERGEHISFANCGLPYHVGGVIPQRESLLVMTPDRFRLRFNADVRTRHEVLAIHRDRRTVTVKKAETGETYEERYEALILATGSRPFVPPIPGADSPQVHTLWTMGDMDRLQARLQQGVQRAVVIGAGFIGLEVAENLHARGLEVHLVDMLPHVLRTLDAEMATPLHQELAAKGVRLHLNETVTAIEGQGPTAPATVVLRGGERLSAELVVMAVGVRPNSELAAAAGLRLAPCGGVAVDEHLRTSDLNIYAVGDVVAVKDAVSSEPALIPLAGPANRQGRIAADNIFGRDSRYRSTLGTSVVQVFGLSAASVGRTGEALTAAKVPFRRIYVHPMSNASYYPGAEPLHLKLLFREDGLLLGAQVVGRKNVEKQIDVLATAMRAGMTVYDLADLELAYAPPYGSAKSPVNFAGMVAANLLRGDSDVVHADSLPKDAVLLDVREPAETELGVIPGALLVPLGKLRQRLSELPRGRQIVAYCKVGLRGYVAERILRQNGFRAANLSGGWVTWKHANPAPAGPEPAPLKAAPTAPAPTATPAADDGTPTPLKASPVVASQPEPALPPGPERRVDVTAMQCPGPIVRVRQELDAMAPGEVLAVTGALPFGNDLKAWCATSGHALLSFAPGPASFAATVRKGEPTSPACTSAPGALQGVPQSATIVLFSNDMDKAMAAFIIATGLASLGTKVTLFFTFWGLSVLRRDPPPNVAKDLLSAMFGFMLPRGASRLALSKMHMLGAGTAMMKQVMAQKSVSSLPDLMHQARSLGVRFIACDMAMNVMGITRAELIDEVDEVAGVGAFAALAWQSGTTLFI
jgi:NADPH-dependent 2,4-dienoyl-CoA reductase/sulfur reductase-like enzyme/peroxiredoxin family protein/rhodanese-related sulfurtransferase/TusA-related sulfurtransferase